MPGFVTHYLFGVGVLRTMEQYEQDAVPGLLECIGAHKTVFQLGLQGPDIFFYDAWSHLLKKNPGSRFHTQQTGDFLNHLIRAQELFSDEYERDIVRAYTAGFLGHYALDTQIHPYVYYLTEFNREPSEKKNLSEHVALETDIDACLLMRYARKLPSQFPAGNTIRFDAAVRRVIAEALCYAYTAVYPQVKLSVHFLSRAVCSMQLGTRLLLSNSGNTKRRVAEWLERVVAGRLVISTIVPCDRLRYSEDPLNLEHCGWCNPWDESAASTESVIELIKKASARYRRMLRLLDGIYDADAERQAEKYERRIAELGRLIGNLSYHSGLECGLDR